MAQVTDEELEQKRRTVEKLRGQVEDQQAKRDARQRDAENSIVAAQLDAEIARLQTQLSVDKEAAKVGSVKEASSGPLDAAKEQQEAAEAQQKAAEEAAAAAKNKSEE